MPAHKAANFKSVKSCRTVERADDPSVKYVTLCLIRSQVTSSPTKILMDCWCSRTFTNGHLSTTATFFGGQSLHWLLFKPRLFTVPYFFVRSFRYTASYRHEYLDFQIYVLASSQTTPAP